MGEIVTAINNLSDWMSPQHKPRDLLNMLNSVYVQPEPYGVLLIMTAWNYPFQLAFAPLAGAIAAGIYLHLSYMLLVDGVCRIVTS